MYLSASSAWQSQMSPGPMWAIYTHVYRFSSEGIHNYIFTDNKLVNENGKTFSFASAKIRIENTMRSRTYRLPNISKEIERKWYGRDPPNGKRIFSLANKLNNNNCNYAFVWWNQRRKREIKWINVMIYTSTYPTYPKKLHT